jgi:hypothetical protein
MSQTICQNCRQPFSLGDVFCGGCGSPREDTEIPAGPQEDASTHADGEFLPFQSAPPDPAPAFIQQPAPQAGLAPGGQPAGFFSHETKVPPDAGRRTNATRYLCAAAYLAPSFANTVIGELIASHRAVAPSRGIDLEPIIRHCLKARRMKLIRDIVLSVLLLVGLVTATVPLIFILAVTFVCGYLPGARWDRRSFGHKALAALAAAVAALLVGGIVVVGVVVVVVLVIVSKLASSAGGSAGTSLPLSGFFSAGFFGFWSLGYVVLLIGTLVRYFWLRNKTLVDWLRPDATAPAFRQESPRVENRIAEVRRAQYGNLTLYNTEDPFIGTGFIPFDLIGKGKKDDLPEWSIAIELNRAGAPRGLLGFSTRDRVDIDPAELHKVLRARLNQLNDPGLPAGQRVAYVTVDDHVVGEGRFDWSFPLIDRQRMIPYSQVNPEAVEALIRAPQGRLRYFQRVSISDEGQPVLTQDQRQVIGPVDREVIASAFIYVAVEGHMFYLQFVPTALAPIDRHFREIDKLPRSSSGRFLGKVLLDALRGAFRDIITAPYNVYKALRLSFREWRNFSEEARAEADFAYADVGARIGVREFGSDDGFQTYIQRLDTNKYTQIVERLVLETVLDYLTAKGADTTAYRASAASIIGSTIISGNTGDWNVNTGAGTQTVR